MKRLLFMVLLAWLPAPAALAQIPAPAPSMDPHVYTDPAMNYKAPDNAVLINRQLISVDQLGSDLQPIAAWMINYGKEDARMITLSMEAYSGPPDQWEGVFESQTHSSQDGTLIRSKTPMTLLNGMPAYFVEVAYGGGFDARKEYAVVWADGARGIVLSETSRLGDATAEEAHNVLKQATAVRYPYSQP